ncbi:hypothetical protein QF042_000344 [Pedobacter sp. W3I1]|uniref:hypothetical protein n=1 Tax=Pedobacter sp. W3I1 TaxID=3042291 RepID=UPI0027823F72|nr:hypothetical protein [Pedobacter sp. W3I1]MDQ0636779.1 hypothetical protein [Pedobacter sp. W3I1]
MKNILSILFFLFVVGQSFGQTTTKGTDIIGQSFVTKTSIPVKVYNPLSKKIDKDFSFLLNDGTKFYIYEVVDSGYIVSVWNYKSTPEKNDFYKMLPGLKERKSDSLPISGEKTGTKSYYNIFKAALGINTVDSAKSSALNKYKNLAYVDSWGNDMQFFIPLKDFNGKCESIYPHKRGFTWGFLTLPIKARFGNSKAPFTFEEKINFGISAGVKWQHVNTVYSASNLLGGISVGSVKVDKDNSASAISLSVGYMYQYDKFQIGLFTGLDFIDKSGTVNWGYQGKPWLGFAIGFSLFGENKTSASTDQTQ